MNKTFCVYMLASCRYGTLYVGVTSNLIKRVWAHREGVVDGFTKEYGVKQLVWCETHTDAMPVITREMQIKKWNRAWKINLIQKENPYWRDQYETLSALPHYGSPPSRGRRFEDGGLNVAGDIFR